MLIVALLAVLLPGCGGDDDDDTAAPTADVEVSGAYTYYDGNLAFSLPDGWEVIDDAAPNGALVVATDPALPEAVRAYSRRFTAPDSGAIGTITITPQVSIDDPGEALNAELGSMGRSQPLPIATNRSGQWPEASSAFSIDAATARGVVPGYHFVTAVLVDDVLVLTHFIVFDEPRGRMYTAHLREATQITGSLEIDPAGVTVALSVPPTE
jgi:hypothetical protein